jgi:hypothetical protein
VKAPPPPPPPPPQPGKSSSILSFQSPEGQPGETEGISVVPTATEIPFTSTVFVTSKTIVSVLPVPSGPAVFEQPPSRIGATLPSSTSSPDFHDKHENPNGQPSNNNNNNNNNNHNQNDQPTNKNNNQNDQPNDKNTNQNDQANNKNNNQNDQANNNNNNNKQNDQPSNHNNNQKETGGQSPGIGVVIASIINQPWMPRPAPSPPANPPASNGNPSGNNQGNSEPVNPAAIISNILKLPTALRPAAPAAPTPPPGHNIPIVVAPSDIVIGNQVIPMPSASDQPKVVVVNGQSFTVAPTGVTGPFTTVPLPAGGGASPMPLNVGGVPVLIVGTTQAIISGQTYTIGPSANPTTVVVNGQMLSIGSAGVGVISTGLAGSGFTKTAIAGVHIGVGKSEVVISGKTYNIGPSATATTIVVSGQTISIGSGGIGFASTTLQGSAFATTAIGGVTFGIGSSQVVVSGTTYDIGPSAAPTTIVVNGQTISIGSGGVGFASTTLQGSSFATTAVAGVTVGIGVSQVVISGTTYDIGPSASPTTIVVNGQTISIGPSGVGFASTTIPAAGATSTSNARTTASAIPSRTGTASSTSTSRSSASSLANNLLNLIIASLVAGITSLILL